MRQGKTPDSSISQSTVSKQTIILITVSPLILYHDVIWIVKNFNILFQNRSSLKIILLHVLTSVPIVPPSIADEPTGIVVTRLSPVVIACTASGVPEPTIHWSKDGMTLPKEGHGYSILPAGQNHSNAKQKIQNYATFKTPLKYSLAKYTNHTLFYEY